KDFITFIDAVDYLVGGVVEPLRWLIDKALAGLRHLGLNLSLYSHWRYVFILDWLLLGACSRAFAPKLSGRGVLALGWAGVCALIFAVIAGSKPLESAYVGVTPFASFMVYMSGMGSIARGTEATSGAVPLLRPNS